MVLKALGHCLAADGLLSGHFGARNLHFNLIPTTFQVDSNDVKVWMKTNRPSLYSGWFFVLKPVKGDVLSIWVVTSGSIEEKLLASLYLYQDRLGTTGAVVDKDNRCMVGLGRIISECPLHTRCKVGLEGTSPAPNGGEIAGISLPIHAYYIIDGIDKMIACHGRVKVAISAAPAAPVRMLRRPQAVLDEIEECRGVTFDEELEVRVLGTQWPDLDILLYPLLCKLARVCTADVGRTRDACPRCDIILAPAMDRADVEDIRICDSDPGTSIVLVRDGIHSDLGSELSKCRIISGLLNV